MNRNIFRGVCVAGAVFAANITGANGILKLSEVKPGNAGSEDTIRNNIVDINSTIKIRIERSAVRDEFYRSMGNVNEDKLGLFQKINAILSCQNKILRLINESRRNPSDTAVYKSLSAMLLDFYNDIIADSSLSSIADEAYVNYRRVYMNKPKTLSVDRYLLLYLGAALDTLTQGIEYAVRNTEQVHFMLTAYKQDKSGGSRIHIENFDSIAQGNYYEVQRWIHSLSEKDREQLRLYQVLTDTLNRNYQEMILGSINQFRASFKTPSCAEALYQESRNLLLKSDDSMSGAIRQLRDTVQHAADNLQELAAISAEMNRLLQARDFGAVLTCLPRAGELLQLVYNNFKAIVLIIDSYGKNYTGEIPAMLQSLKQRFEKECRPAFEHDRQLVQTFAGDLQDIIDPSSKVYRANEKIGREVKKFSFADIPDIGYIDLKYTGRRDENDRILIKAMLCIQNDSNAVNVRYKEIERKTIALMKLGFHSEANIGIIFAHPDKSYNPENVKLSTRFQFAAATSFIVKYGFRSHAYNTYLDFGLGINLAYPDFNLDGTPEYCMGILVAGFKNVLSAGVDWNFGVDVPLYFIGISLPFNIFDFPFVKSQTAGN